MLNLIKRDSLLVKTIADRGMVIQATCQISRIDVKPGYTNIALQKITMIINDKEYHMDHIWLQGQDYPKYFGDMAVEGEWFDLDIAFYPYRDKINKNEYGITMHGIEVVDAWELTNEEVIKTSEEIFKDTPGSNFTVNFKKRKVK